MKRRLVTALIAGGIAAAVGIGVAIWQGQTANMLWIALATASVGFIFRLRVQVHDGMTPGAPPGQRV